MAHASSAEGESGKYDEYFNDHFAAASLHLSENLTKHRDLLSTLNRSERDTTLRIFYPGCGVMPGLAALINKLIEHTSFRTFHITAVDIDNQFPYLARLLPQKLREAGIHELNMRHERSMVSSSSPARLTAAEPSKVTIDFYAANVKDFIRQTRERVSYDLIFLEFPTIEGTMSLFNSAARDYRETIGLFYGVANPGALVICCNYNPWEKAHSKDLLDHLPTRETREETDAISTVRITERPYRNLLVTQVGAYPPGQTPEARVLEAEKHADVIAISDISLRLWMGLSTWLSMASEPLEPGKLITGQGSLTNWLSLATLLCTLSQIPMHRTGMKGLAIHAGITAVQALCWYFQSSEGDAAAPSPSLGSGL